MMIHMVSHSLRASLLLLPLAFVLTTSFVVNSKTVARQIPLGIQFKREYGRSSIPCPKSKSFIDCGRRRKTQVNLLPTDFHTLLTANAVQSHGTLIDSHNFKLIEWYGNLLRDKPISTKSITSGLLTSIGDAIAQFKSVSNDNEDSNGTGKNQKSFQYDIKRGVAFLAFGALYTGLFQHFWFQYLDSHIVQWGEALGVWGPPFTIPVGDVYALDEWWMYMDVVKGIANPPSVAALAVGKLFINQFVMIPGLYMSIFFTLSGALANLNWEQSIARARTKYVSLLQRNYMYWLPMQFIQFFCVPNEFQIPFLSTAGLVWAVVLSSIAVESPQSQPDESVQIIYENETTQIEQAEGILAFDNTDNVRYEDIENALIPETARNVMSDPKLGTAVAGGAFGLLASAANDALLTKTLLVEGIGEALGVFEAGPIVAFLTGIGATIGFLLGDREKVEGQIFEFGPLDQSENNQQIIAMDQEGFEVRLPATTVGSSQNIVDNTIDTEGNLMDEDLDEGVRKKSCELEIRAR